VVRSAYQEDAVVREVIAGVRGYVLKSESSHDLVMAVESVLSGRPFFSARIATERANIRRGLGHSLPTATRSLEHQRFDGRSRDPALSGPLSTQLG
jgi:DNA-binding NarL/FixJ family response regulator